MRENPPSERRLDGRNSDPFKFSTDRIAFLAVLPWNWSVVDATGATGLLLALLLWLCVLFNLPFLAIAMEMVKLHVGDAFVKWLEPLLHVYCSHTPRLHIQTHEIRTRHTSENRDTKKYLDKNCVYHPYYYTTEYALRNYIEFRVLVCGKL